MSVEQATNLLPLVSAVAWRSQSQVAPMVEIAIPVYNEERDLEGSVRRLHRFLSEKFPFSAGIVIVDNASTDGTWARACHLAAELHEVRAIHLEAKGRGGALRAAWGESRSPIVAYMDVDLSTGLEALLPLVAPLVSGHSDIAIGSRLSPGARVVRGAKREVISRSYNAMLHATLGTRFRDAQCGFKAARATVVQSLLPAIVDNAWFFDTELLVLAERSGLRVHEVAVDWVDDPDSRVHLMSTSLEDLRGVWRLRRTLPNRTALQQRFGTRPPLPPTLLGQALRFSWVGVLSTISYLLLFVLGRTLVPAVAANLAALLIAAIGNTAMNRRYTFTRSAGWLRDHLSGLAAFAVALTLSTLALVGLDAVDPHASRAAEGMVLVAASVMATAVRFSLLRFYLASCDGVAGSDLQAVGRTQPTGLPPTAVVMTAAPASSGVAG